MEEICFKIPEDLKSELKEVSNIELSILFTKFIRDKLSQVEKFRKVVSKSQLTQEQAEELSDEINKSLSKRYEQFSK